MGLALTLTMIILGIIILIITIIVMVRNAKKIERQEVPPNAPFIDVSTRREFTNGYTFGLIKEIIPCRNKTSRISFYPLDSEQGEDKPLPSVQTLIVGEKYLKPFAQGENSSRRVILKVLPRTKMDIPYKMREELEGKWMHKEGIKAFIQDSMEIGTKNLMDAFKEYMKDWAGGQLTKKEYQKQREKFNELMKIYPLQPQQVEQK